MEYLTKYRACCVVQVAALFGGVFGVWLIIGAGYGGKSQMLSAIVLFVSVVAGFVSSVLAIIYKNKAKTYKQNSDKIAAETLAEAGRQKGTQYGQGNRTQR